jgi:hypothetical protein
MTYPMLIEAFFSDFQTRRFCCALAPSANWAYITG